MLSAAHRNEEDKRFNRRKEGPKRTSSSKEMKACYKVLEAINQKCSVFFNTNKHEMLSNMNVLRLRDSIWNPIVSSKMGFFA